MWRFAIVTRPQFRWTFLSATAVAILIYAAHLMIGGIVLVLAVSRDPSGAAGYFIAFAGWFGFGALDLIRLVPRNREPPAFLMKPGMRRCHLSDCHRHRACGSVGMNRA